MSDERHSKTAKTILALGLLGLMLWCAPATRAAEHGDSEKAATIPGLVDKNALDHFQMPPLNVSVIREGKVARILTVTVTMETKGDENKNKVMAQRFELQTAFLRDLYGVASFRRVDGRVIDPDVVKTRLQEISDRILGEGIVESVLVVSIFDRKLS